MKFNYKKNSDLAYALHQEGKLDDAEKIYKKLISVSPDDYNVLNLYGLLLISKEKYEEAVTYLSKAMLIKQDAYIISNLAKAYYMNNQFEKSAKMYATALKFDENDDIYYSLALTYKKLNKFDEAEKSYIKAVELNPNNLNAYYNLVLLCSDLGETDKAIKFGLEACKNNEVADDIYTLLSGLYESKGNDEKAIYYLHKAVEASPKEAIYYYNLGVLYSKTGKIDEAIENYRKSLLINPENIESYVNIAALYKKKKQQEIAVQYLEIAYEIDDKEPVLVLSLAQTYKDLGQNEKSIEILNKFLTINNKLLNQCAAKFVKYINENQNSKSEKLYINAEKINKNGAEACSLIAMNLMDTGKYAEASEYYDKAIESDPDNLSYKHGKAVSMKYLGKINVCKKMLEDIVKTGKADSQTKITLGMIYLQNKQLQKGMNLYRERNTGNAFIDVFKDKLYSLNEDISDKTVLLYSNCGLGDTIMYSRFFDELKHKCKSLILQTDSQLVKILRYNFPDINIIKKSVSMPDFDVTIPVMDIQYFLDIDFKDIKKTDFYLNADEKLTEFFAKELFVDVDKKKIGLCWQGNKKIFKNRSVDFSYIDDLIKNDKYEYYSFQVKEASEEKEGMHSLKKYIFNYNDTAALLKNMDLMITIDSSIAHMAGALGVKTFLLLPHTAEWRWFNDTDTTLWYKSVKIFKQQSPSDWASVFDRIKSELDT